MMILILLLLAIGVVIFVFSLGSDNVSKVRCLTWTSAILITYGVCLGIEYDASRTKPTPLDVYRGNTELEITSVNGIPTDTVVVFKNK